MVPRVVIRSMVVNGMTLSETNGMFMKLWARLPGQRVFFEGSSWTDTRLLAGAR